MARRTLFFATGSCLILAACSHTVPKLEGTSGHVKLNLNCNTQLSDSNKCVVAIENPDCEKLSPDNCSARLNYDWIVLADNSPRLKLHWQLPDGYAFCPKEGDGVFLKREDPDDQFDKIGATGKDVNVGKKKCKDTVQWIAQNDKKGKDYEYRVLFRSTDPTNFHVYAIDPWIANGR
jgi:hypothetical protein